MPTIIHAPRHQPHLPLKEVTNGVVYLLLPETLKFEVVVLWLDSRDPASMDAAEFKLLREEMN